MGWTVPGTPVAGQKITTAWWIEQVRDNLNDLYSRNLRAKNADDSGRGYQRGTVSIDFSTEHVKSSAVTFPTAFAELPDVICQGTQTTVYMAFPLNITLNGFDFYLRHHMNTDLTVVGIPGLYFAHGA
jgi:hypothetical protein